MKLMISEVLRKAHNAKTKAQKIKILQDNNTQTLRSIFIMNYDESLVSRIPPGDVLIHLTKHLRAQSILFLKKKARNYTIFLKVEQTICLP